MSTKTTTMDYGMVMNNQILLAFGNEVCYNTLKRFTGIKFSSIFFGKKINFSKFGYLNEKIKIT